MYKAHKHQVDPQVFAEKDDVEVEPLGTLGCLAELELDVLGLVGALGGELIGVHLKGKR